MPGQGPPFSLTWRPTLPRCLSSANTVHSSGKTVRAELVEALPSIGNPSTGSGQAKLRENGLKWTALCQVLAKGAFLNNQHIWLAGLGRAASLRISCVARHTARFTPGIPSQAIGQMHKLFRYPPKCLFWACQPDTFFPQISGHLKTILVFYPCPLPSSR